MRDEIRTLLDRERELNAELNALPDPLEQAESVAAGLAVITRREEARRGREAVIAHRRTLEARQQDAQKRDAEITYLRQSIVELKEKLPRARALDDRLGTMRPSPSNEEVCRRNLELERQQLAALEAGGPLPQGTRLNMS